MDTRPSPTERSALYRAGTIKIGNDGNKWVVKKDKNGIKRWKRYKPKTKVPAEKTSNKGICMNEFYGVKLINQEQLEQVCQKNKSANHIFNTLKTNIIPAINDLGIEPFIVPLPFSTYNVYWQDYPSDYIRYVYGKHFLELNYIYFVFYLNQNGNQINFSKPIKISFREMNKENKIKIIKLFEMHLLGYFKWSGSNNETMSIHFTKEDTPKRINLRKIKDDDTYPILCVQFDSNIDLHNKKK